MQLNNSGIKPRKGRYRRIYHPWLNQVFFRTMFIIICNYDDKPICLHRNQEQSIKKKRQRNQLFIYMHYIQKTEQRKGEIGTRYTNGMVFGFNLDLHPRYYCG